eukprot:6462041-Amphidinium_carterae.2
MTPEGEAWKIHVLPEEAQNVAWSSLTQSEAEVATPMPVQVKPGLNAKQHHKKSTLLHHE